MDGLDDYRSQVSCDGFFSRAMKEEIILQLHLAQRCSPGSCQFLGEGE